MCTGVSPTLDREAAEYVEFVICMRTHFTGDPPYVGWKGLGLALDEALDERDRLRAVFQEIEFVTAAQPLQLPVALLTRIHSHD